MTKSSLRICRYVVSDNSTVKIFSIFVAFLESLSYQIEVLTTSVSREEITVVRLSPKALEAGLRETLRKNFKVSNTEKFLILCIFIQ